MNQQQKSYRIGLDIGDSSMGFAMTDENGRLLKHQKKNTWGVVLFDQASPAVERRVARSGRRRYDRKEHRIDDLQELMANDVLTADPAFYLKLNESFLHAEDRKYPNLYGSLPQRVFDADPADAKYPTIYHLRESLAVRKDRADIRYVYLALHHIMKYRGHFLFADQPLEALTQDIVAEIKEMLEYLRDEKGYALTDDPHCAEQMKALLLSTKERGKEKVKQMMQLLRPEAFCKKAINHLAKLLIGQTANLRVLFDAENEELPEKLSLADEYDENGLVEALESDADAFLQMQKIYRWQVFAALRDGNHTISHTMVLRYEKHARDLKMLKRAVKKHCTKEEYHSLFSNPTREDGYCAYTAHESEVKHCTQEDFYASVKKLLKGFDDEDCRYILTAMEEHNGFLPLQRINFNGSIPNRFHAEEMKLILDNQSAYYPTLKENKDKILRLCTFRLPYYVGPLNAQSSFAWAVRKDDTQRVKPWNFDEVIDRAATAERFMRKLTNHCSYLPTEEVLPLHSLLFEEYMLLDELNRVKYALPPQKPKGLTYEQKMQAIGTLFAKQRRVTCKRFAEWLETQLIGVKASELRITGTHKEDAFAASLGSRIDFCANGFSMEEASLPMIEEIIKWSTLFEDRNILREKLKTTYPQLTEQQIKVIRGKRYTGWASLSAKLLNGLQGHIQERPVTVIEAMRETDCNLMKVLNHDHMGFKEALEEATSATKEGEITLEEVRELQGSPMLKRSVWQAVKVVKELIGDQRHLPEAIYIEVTRSPALNKRGKRTQSRKEILQRLYEDAGFTGEVAEKLKDSVFRNEDSKSGKPKSKDYYDRLYLYFLQQGKCLYSGAKLEIPLLETYQVDHILPQAYVKDDSIDNRALVVMTENQSKRDNLMLSEEIQKHQRGTWLYLLDHGLMSAKKFANLTRQAVEMDEMVGFINRQLVETSQIIRHVIELFKAHYPTVKIRSVPARLSSACRGAYDLYKVRELNDMHHAYDAFLACVMGGFVDRYMSWLSDDTLRSYKLREYIAKELKQETNGIVMGMFNRDQIDPQTGEVLRNHLRDIDYLKKTWAYKDFFMVYKKDVGSGEFFDQQPIRHQRTTAKSIPLRKNLPVEKYGAYATTNLAYMAAIAYGKGKKRACTLVNVPIYLAKALDDEAKLLEWLQTQYDDVETLRPKILLNQLIEYKGQRMLLHSCTETYNATELFLPPNQVKLLYRICKQQCQWEQKDERQVDELIDLLIEKMKMYYPKYDGSVKRLLAAREKIQSLTMEEKGRFVKETLKIMQVGKLSAMYKTFLPQLGIKNEEGRSANPLSNVGEAILIDQSTTGFYEKRRKLWDSEPSSSKAPAN